MYRMALLFIGLLVMVPKNAVAQNQFVLTGNCIALEKVSNANVVVKDLKTLSIINYTTTDAKGNFTLKFKTTDKAVNLVITALGHKTLIREVMLIESTINLGIITLENDTNELKEVIIESEQKAIIKKGDTTIYNVKRFLNGTEDTLKDLIEKLPGMTINENGKIEVNGKVISELLIDGDNLYKSQHQFTTENLSSKIVKSVEFYKNHVMFDEIKTDSITSKTAVNIIIKDEYKNKFKGDLQLENNFINRYKAGSTLYNFGKKNKFSLIQNWNNLGELPISIMDYFVLVDNEEKESGQGSSVEFKNYESIPKFLKSGENVAAKDNSFFTISNVYSPSKKFKNSFYAILNTANQRTIFENIQQFSDNILDIVEKSTSSEKSLFAILDLKTVYKPNDKTIFKINNFAVIDNTDINDGIQSIVNTNAAIIGQVNDSSAKKFENNAVFTKKFKNASFSNNTFFNHQKNVNTAEISSTLPILEPLLVGATFFYQHFNRSVTRYGNDANYNLKIKKYTIGFKAMYTATTYDFDNGSSSLETYFNRYQLKEHFFTQQVNATIPFSRKFFLNISINNNSVRQHSNDELQQQSNFVGYSFGAKMMFTTNSILQLSHQLSNTLSNPDNLIENFFVKDYRTVIRTLDLQPNTVFPLRKLTLNYLKSNPETNTFLIINANHSWAARYEGTNINNMGDFSIFENTINGKSEFSNFMIFYEKNFSTIPFRASYNIDINYSFKEFLTNNEQSFFKSTYISNSFNIRSKFKKSDVHFNLGFLTSNAVYTTNDEPSTTKVHQFSLNCNGMFLKNFFWQTSYSYNKFMVNNTKNVIPILSGSLRYSCQKSNWSYTICAHNVLNLTNSVFVTNTSGAGFAAQLTNVNLAGYISFGAKYKF
jgi:hypothetical protein